MIQLCINVTSLKGSRTPAVCLHILGQFNCMEGKNDNYLTTSASQGTASLCKLCLAVRYRRM
jgi:hypothetical protein